MNKKQNDYDERLKYRVGRTKLLIVVISVLFTLLGYIVLASIPKSSDDPLYLVEIVFWAIPIPIIAVIFGTGELGERKKTASEWSSFMIAQFLKERDRKKELEKNTIMKEQQTIEHKDDNKDDDWSDF